MSDPYQGVSADPTVPGIVGENTAGQNSVGVRSVVQELGWGVLGESHSGTGVVGMSQSSYAIYAKSTDAAGILAESTNADGVFGVTHNSNAIGVSGHNDLGTAVWGGSKSGRGVAGFSETWQGVYGHSVAQAGVVGESDQFDGVFGISHSNQHAAVTGQNTAGGMAGYFNGHCIHDGNVTHNGNVITNGTHTVTGDVVLTNADCAEEFDIAAVEEIEPGTVMVLNQEGTLQPSHQAYDRKVAGVISGAGDYKPGIVLDKQQSSENRRPVALVGKVYCKVDAGYTSIEVGDMLTTSDTPGHAMKACDPFKAFGAVIGKALRPLREGQGLIPILIALQ